MDSSTEVHRYATEAITAQIVSIASAVGVSEPDARLLADALIDADLSGTNTHGVSRLGIYIRRIRKGLISPDAELGIDRDSGAVMAMDAGNGLGQVQAQKALKLLEPRAREYGVAVATIRNSQHFGTLSFYCDQMARRDMILLATTNCEPAMSPTGGCDPIFGTNPIGASFPSAHEQPVKVDLATSIVARGNIIMAQKRGDSIPEGWALDPDGASTTDPDKALAGTVLTMAGHKGYAMALLVEFLAGVLSGAAVGPDVGSMYKDMSKRQNVGHFFCLLNVAAFMDVKEFKERGRRLVERIKSSRKQPGISEILVPGERSHKTRRINESKGVPIQEATLTELKKLCEELNTPFTLSPI